MPFYHLVVFVLSSQMVSSEVCDLEGKAQSSDSDLPRISEFGADLLKVEHALVRILTDD